MVISVGYRTNSDRTIQFRRWATRISYKEYDKFKIKQDKLYKSDFDNFLNEARMIENGSDK